MFRPNPAFLNVLFCLFLFSNSASALVYSVQDDFASGSLGRGIEYLAVDSKSSSIDDVSSESDWRKVTTSQAAFGFDDRVYWLRFDLLNEDVEPHDLLIELSNSYLKKIDFYVLDRNWVIREFQTSGDYREQEIRAVRHAENIHPFVLPAGEPLSLYIRVESNSSLSIPIQLWERNAFITYDYMRTVGLGVYLGLMIVLGLYHLIITALTRDSSAFFYTILIFSLLVVFAYRKGVPSSLLSSGFVPSTQTANIVAISLFGCSICFFTSRILQLRLTNPGLADLMQLAGIVALAPILAYLFVDYSLVLRFSLGYSTLLIGLYSVALIRRISDGYPPARHMIVASVFGITGSGLAIAASFDLVPVTIMVQTIIYSSNALMALFLALTLSYRINMDRMLLEEAERQHTHELDELVRQQTEELESVNDRLRIVSITDGLTRLYNRGHFDYLLRAEYNRAFREKQSLGILLVDVDHFKQINDTFGHKFGDLCLIRTGEIIRNCLQRPLDTAARYGGEEFVLLLPDTDLRGALHMAESLRSAIASTTVRQDDSETVLTVSVGVAVEIPAQADQHEALLKRADEWMYEAKRRGRNRVEGDR